MKGSVQPSAISRKQKTIKVRGLLASSKCNEKRRAPLVEKEPMGLIPMGIMTIVLGSLLGYFIDKFGENAHDK
ncbi:MAG: hypothetical protein ABIJ30_07395 [bacterium]